MFVTWWGIICGILKLGQEIMDRRETQGVGTCRSASGCTSLFIYFIGMFVLRERSLHPIT